MAGDATDEAGSAGIGRQFEERAQGATEQTPDGSIQEFIQHTRIGMAGLNQVLQEETAKVDADEQQLRYYSYVAKATLAIEAILKGLEDRGVSRDWVTDPVRDGASWTADQALDIIDATTGPPKPGGG